MRLFSSSHNTSQSTTVRYVQTTTVCYYICTSARYVTHPCACTYCTIFLEFENLNQFRGVIHTYTVIANR